MQDPQSSSTAETSESMSNNNTNLDIAIVGMAGRFPGANNLDEFWDNLRHGVESIRFYSEEEVIESGIFPHMAKDPDFVPAAGGIDHEFDFDAEFFDFNPREAEITDPQQRIALETAWEALESAGYNPEVYDGRIGVFAGVSINSYLLFNLASSPSLLDSIGHFQVMTANDKDFLATRIAYKLNLKGPALSVQTACSTGLVAANLACQSLLNYQSDMVIAGGVSITPKGRLYKEGFIFSKDGHCRAFDEKAQGTVGGNGVGFVILKRLEDALADGDHIHAIIKGSAVNNDGALKVGYTAPSVSGQVEVITEAQELAGVDPNTITYMEAHGTGTLLGDPIEIAALTQAFRRTTDRKQYCAIGSVKSNIGHLDTAAGISGFIKAVMCVEKAEIPPSLHFNKANPKLNIEESPFFVNTELKSWQTEVGIPRRAAVSSFGFGGTNAHSIIQQAPELTPSEIGRKLQVIPLSGRNPEALQANIEKLGTWLQDNPNANLADISYTMQVGRKGFKHRAYLATDSCADGAKKCLDKGGRSLPRNQIQDTDKGVVMMFSGQGSQHVQMMQALYENEIVFRDSLNQVITIANSYLNCDLQKVIFPAGDQAEAAELLAQTRNTQPALFAVEYALAQWWLAQGVKPTAMIGHSVGEYVAATLAGVFSLDTAVKVICRRGESIQRQATGAMLSIPLPLAEVELLLDDQLSLAAVNAPSLCVVSGPESAIIKLQKTLEEKEVECRRLVVSHAFHSHMLSKAEAELTEFLTTLTLNKPQIPFISNVTGQWITDEQACSPKYWGQHLRKPVLFSQGLSVLLDEHPAALLEVGPGQVLSTLARQHRDQLKGSVVVTSCRHPQSDINDQMQLMSAVGALWSAGVEIDWTAIHEHLPRRRVPLPTYSFQRQRYWLAPQSKPTLDYSINSASSNNSTTLPISNSGPRPGYVAPQNELEMQIAKIWEQMLGIGYISRDDDFFQLGGHSLLATQLIAEVRRQTGQDVLVQSLFKDPTIVGLANAARELQKDQQQEQTSSLAEKIKILDRSNNRLPLTFHQEMVWDFERKWPGTTRFNGLISLRLTGKFDLEAAQFSADEILRRHEVLRTCYCHENGKSYAIINPPHHLDIPLKDFSAYSKGVRDAKLVELINAHLRKPFDLTKDLLVRPLFVKMTEEEHLIVMSSHYAAVDGWTIGLVVQEFAAHYASYKNPELPKLPDLDFQIVDYAAWEKTQITDESLKPALDYWDKQLRDVRTQAPLPLDHVRSIVPSVNGATFHFNLGTAMTNSVKQFCNEQGATQFMIFVAILNALYRAYSGEPEQVIGTMTGGRDIGIENQVGALVNMIALRTKVDDEISFNQFIENVKQVTTDAFSHPAPFTKIVKRLNRNMVRNPLFRTVFILRSVPATEASAGDLHVELASVNQDRAVADCDITLYLQEKKGDLQGYYEYNRDLFDRTTIETLVRDFKALIADIITNPDMPLKLLLPQPANRKPRATPIQKVLSRVGVYQES